MTNEIRRARRELKRLNDRLTVVRRGSIASEIGSPIWIEAQRWKGEITARIKQQELEVRRLACAARSLYFDTRYANEVLVWHVAGRVTGGSLLRKFKGRNAMRSAVSLAERQNRKAIK